jgi:hypothetical protein
MASYKVTFNGGMGDVTGNQISNIQEFLNAEITTDYEGEEDVWLVETSKKLTPSLMNTALARAGVRNRQVVSIDEEDDSDSSSDSDAS